MALKCNFFLYLTPAGLHSPQHKGTPLICYKTDEMLDPTALQVSENENIMLRLLYLKSFFSRLSLIIPEFVHRLSSFV